MARHHCDECNKNDEGCCSASYAKFVTIGDVRRISIFLGKKPSAFLKYAGLTKNDKKTDLYRKRPHGYYYDITADGKLLQLKSRKDSSCIFFEKGSCNVYPVRPLICRVFPFWFSESRIIVDNNGFDCPIVCGSKPLSRNPSGKSIISAMGRMGYTEKEMVAMISQLMKEMEEYKKGIASFVRKSRL
jgi:Fe-S-cluster containining protein